MSKTTKDPTFLDYQQVLRNTFNDVDSSVLTTGFLTGKIGRKVEQIITTTTVANDTADFTYYENGTLLYKIRVIYTDATQAIMLSAERIA